MTSRRILFSALVLGAFAITLVLLTPPTTAQDASTSSRPKWEYKIADTQTRLDSIDINQIAPGDPNQHIKKALEQFLNKQGKDGWELVAYSGTMAIYKRPVGSK